ncbi:hypothetical protein AVEN_255565-1 [Araneus ventricosus]|uniref:Uncharacterized protein n=1 Tax=Araneus ventricosus TaxID=182803 RepID=A0A4Y2PE87_ARAVE|nr:hypothetical protein AVEN_255565-1 [Araneus ventricosus]
MLHLNLKLTEKVVPIDPLPPKRNFQLPQLQLKKFNGDARDYLAFWSQFQKIHADPDIPNEDKMQYLIQVVEEGSKAERLVQSFPATASNYPKAIQQLQERFGRDDLLVQIYVRDLLSMVMKNSTTGRMKISLPILYGELEGKLKALESLGKTRRQKYGDFLTPLVESCLPEELLIAWERSRSNESETKNSRSLSDLMAFLQGEVRSEEMILLARSGFEDKQCRKKEISIVSEKQTGSPTAAALVSLSSSGKRNSNCIFCNKRHPGFKCFDARKMTRQERLNILLKKGACFTCLYKSGHISKFCDKKSRIKCKLCSDPHYEIMCKRYNSKNVQNSMDVGDHSSNSEVALSNAGRGRTVYLQTLEVVIRGQGREKRIRIVLDSGSMSSHISDRTIKQLGLKPHRVETIVNILFGGNETSPREKGLYAIEIKALDESFSVCLEALSEEKICGFLPKINDRIILRELKNRKIKITDSVSGEYEIDLLIDADLLGSLLTGEIVELDCGLTAVHTKLGWTIMGKQKGTISIGNVMTTLSMHCRSVNLTEMWDLECLGITDPSQSLCRKKAHSEDLNDFREKLTILPSGRYEVGLPWKSDSRNLPDNKELSWERHEKMVKRMKARGILCEYQEVFDNWERLKIIERVPENELKNEKCHYLPHRPVIKMQSETTRIRPVFDALPARRENLP